MDPRGKKIHEKNCRLTRWVPRAFFLGAALMILVFAVNGAHAQGIDDHQPFGLFQKEERFHRYLKIEAFDSALDTSQTYSDTIIRLDPDGATVGFSGIDHSLNVSLDGRGSLYNIISSVPFRPGGPYFRGTTFMGADNTDPEKGLAADERYAFVSCCPTAGSAAGVGFNTQLNQGMAVSSAGFDTVSQEFSGSYLGDGTGAVGIGTGISSGTAGGSQSYSSFTSVEGDYRISYSVNSGPGWGCPFGW